jgi:hypothetical protein
MATSTRINGFLWNRVSQGYSRVVTDEPPFESWRAWRAGYSRDQKPALHLTPTSSPVRELPSELDGCSAAVVALAGAEETTQGSSSNCGANGYDITCVRTVTAPPMLATAAASTRSSSSYSESATRSRRGVGRVITGVINNGDGDEEMGELEYVRRS